MNSHMSLNRVTAGEATDHHQFLCPVPQVLGGARLRPGSRAPLFLVQESIYVMSRRSMLEISVSQWGVRS